MTLQVDFSPQISAQLTQAARLRGTDPVKVLESLVAEYLPPVLSTPVDDAVPLLAPRMPPLSPTLTGD